MFRRRWPLCPLHEDGEPPHELRIAPDLGADPSWMCEEHGVALAPLGQLPVGWRRFADGLPMRAPTCEGHLLPKTFSRRCPSRLAPWT